MTQPHGDAGHQHYVLLQLLHNSQGGFDIQAHVEGVDPKEVPELLRNVAQWMEDNPQNVQENDAVAADDPAALPDLGLDGLDLR